MTRVTVLALMTVTVALCATTISRANPILAGDDLLTTTPGNPVTGTGTKFQDPVVDSGTIYLQGNPPVGGDTVVRRLQDANFLLNSPCHCEGTFVYPGPSTPGTQVPIDIQMLQLNLQGVAPVLVSGNPYDVSVMLNPSLASTGIMNITHEWADSGDIRPEGYFDAHFAFIHAILTFTPVSAGSPFQQFVDLALDSVHPTPWTHRRSGPGTEDSRFAVIGTAEDGLLVEAHYGEAQHPSFEEQPEGEFFDAGGGVLLTFRGGISAALALGVPEPGSLVLASLGLFAFAGRVRRRCRK